MGQATNTARKAPQQDPRKCYEAGLRLLEREDLREAILAFELAHLNAPDNPIYMSYLGLALTMARTRGKEGLKLCEKAAANTAYYPELYHNLGRVYLIRGNRRKARQAFLIGLKIDRTHTGMLEQMEKLGLRKNPPLPFLSRSHPVNKHLGMLLKRLNLR
jgi:tetratricopeptide (TPR) repeat protein